MRLCFGLHIMGIEPVMDYLDYVTDIPGFHHRYLETDSDMRAAMLGCLDRYTTTHPGTKKCNMSIEEMLDTWIKRKSGNA